MTQDPRLRPATPLAGRLNSPRGESSRLFCGIHVSSGATSIQAALVATEGHGLDATLNVLATRCEPVVGRIAECVQRLEKDSPSPASAAVAASLLAEQQASLVEATIRSAHQSAQDVLAVGVHDPGLWNVIDHSATARVGLCDAARLAEKTGLNVVDAFPDRDLAVGGLGGPIWPLAEWILLRDPLRTRVLVDLGRCVTLTLLPPRREGTRRLVSFQVGPGSALLDLLASQLTSGEKRYDPGGSLAVQGQRIPELLDHWLSDPYFKLPTPRWHPWGVRPERFFTESVQMAIEASWSVRDLLCSATHFIAISVERAVSRLPQAAVVDEVVVGGGGQQNGLLLRELGNRLPGRELLRSSDWVTPGDALRPVAIALLTMMHVDHVPGNSSALTGAARPAVLGRLTPGSSDNWLRLVRELSSAGRTGESFRRAG